jgi:hypothetical protein
MGRLTDLLPARATRSPIPPHPTADVAALSPIGRPHFVNELIDAERPHVLEQRDDIRSHRGLVDHLQELPRVVTLLSAAVLEIRPEPTRLQEIATDRLRGGSHTRRANDDQAGSDNDRTFHRDRRT